MNVVMNNVAPQLLGRHVLTTLSHFPGFCSHEFSQRKARMTGSRMNAMVMTAATLVVRAVAIRGAGQGPRAGARGAGLVATVTSTSITG